METVKMKKEVSNDECCIEIDRDQVIAQIVSCGIYKEPGLSIQQWQGEKQSEYYVVSATQKKYSYRGMLNSRFQRQNYGVNYYSNGDTYFGGFDIDNREKHGAYLFSPVIEDSYVKHEMYFGLWKDNLKDHHGIYTWIKQTKDTDDFSNADMDAFLGDIQNEKMKRGCYFYKTGNDFYLYYGSFDDSGNKNDDKAFIYDNKRDRVFCGKIVKGKFVNAYLMFHDEEGNFSTMIRVDYDENQSPVNIIKFEDIELKIRDEKLKEMSQFRTIIFEEDCFVILYEKWNEIKCFINKELNNPEIFNNDNYFPKLMKLSASHNDISLYRKLEKIIRKE